MYLLTSLKGCEDNPKTYERNEIIARMILALPPSLNLSQEMSQQAEYYLTFRLL